MPNQYNKAKGKSKMRKDFRNKLENINVPRGDTKVQRYVKLIPVLNSWNWIKIAETDLYAVRTAAGKVFIIKPLSITYPVAHFIKCQ